MWTLKFVCFGCVASSTVACLFDMAFADLSRGFAGIFAQKPPGASKHSFLFCHVFILEGPGMILTLKS